MAEADYKENLKIQDITSVANVIHGKLSNKEDILGDINSFFKRYNEDDFKNLLEDEKLLKAKAGEILRIIKNNEKEILKEGSKYIKLQEKYEKIKDLLPKERIVNAGEEVITNDDSSLEKENDSPDISVSLEDDNQPNPPENPLEAQPENLPEDPQKNPPENPLEAQPENLPEDPQKNSPENQLGDSLEASPIEFQAGVNDGPDINILLDNNSGGKGIFDDSNDKTDPVQVNVLKGIDFTNNKKENKEYNKKDNKGNREYNKWQRKCLRKKGEIDKQIEGLELAKLFRDALGGDSELELAGIKSINAIYDRGTFTVQLISKDKKATTYKLREEQVQRFLNEGDKNKVYGEINDLGNTQERKIKIKKPVKANEYNYDDVQTELKQKSNALGNMVDILDSVSLVGKWRIFRSRDVSKNGGIVTDKNEQKEIKDAIKCADRIGKWWARGNMKKIVKKFTPPDNGNMERRSSELSEVNEDKELKGIGREMEGLSQNLSVREEVKRPEKEVSPTEKGLHSYKGPEKKSVDIDGNEYKISRSVSEPDLRKIGNLENNERIKDRSKSLNDLSGADEIENSLGKSKSKSIYTTASTINEEDRTEITNDVSNSERFLSATSLWGLKRNDRDNSSEIVPKESSRSSISVSSENLTKEDRTKSDNDVSDSTKKSIDNSRKMEILKSSLQMTTTKTNDKNKNNTPMSIYDRGKDKKSNNFPQKNNRSI